MNVREQREQCGWSQEQAAEACGCSLGAWQDFEGDSGAFTDTFLPEWLTAYRVRMNDRYGWLLGDWPLDSVGPC